VTEQLSGNWNYPTQVRFGAGRLAEIGDGLAELGITRPLVVTDAGLVSLPVIARLLELCAGAGRTAALFSGVDGNPVGGNVEAGIDAFRQGTHDGVIAIGGGSALDVGKAIALMAGQRCSLWDLEDVGDNWRRADAAAIAPCIAIPTTAGTGSEVGRSSVITNEAERRKIIVFHPGIVPDLVLCDPELTISLPARLTAATGMDALSHNLEAWCARGFHPMADGIALEGVRLVARHLRRAVAEPEDLEARAAMLAASLMGATAFQKGLGAMHAMSHPIGARLGCHHGEINAVVMPYVLAHNLPAIDERLARLARAIELPEPTARGFVVWTVELKAALGIPTTLAELGVPGDRVDELAAMAVVDPAGAGNPVPLNEADYVRLYRAALAGRLQGD
jgi:alcohol dehydrogenase class IV